MKKENLYMAVVMLLLISVTTIVYSPGLKGIFLFDDKPNIVDNKGLILEDYSLQSFVNASLSGVSTLKRPISMFSFALNIEVCGLSPYCFKTVNLAIHILCGLLIFALARLIMLRYREYYSRAIEDKVIILIAAGAAVLWLLHPLNLTNVLYVVQRMNSLSAFFSLAGMIFYMLGRNGLLKGDSGRTYVVLGFLMTVPAMFSKENGILLPFFLLLIEAFFFQLKSAKNSDKQLLKLAFFISVVIPVVFIAGYMLTNPAWLQKIYAYREFNLYERLLSESRILWFYVSLIFFPSNQRLSLYHDHVDISRGLLDPVTTLISIVGWLAVVAVVVYARKRQPLISFGLLFFLGGHMVESTFIPLELVFEHRNYLPSIGIILLLSYYLIEAGVSVNTVRIRRGGLVSLLLLFGIVTSLRASQWGNPLLLAELEVRNNQESPRVHNLAGNIYASMLKHIPDEEREQYYNRALELFENTSKLDPKNTSGLVSIHILKAREKGIHDNESYKKVLERLRRKKLTATDSVSIKQLIVCLENNTCSDDIVNIDRLADVIDANPYASGRYKAIAYGSVGLYYWKNDIDKDKALNYVEKAFLNYKGSRILNLNYAKALISKGYYDEARDVLTRIKENDFFGVRQDEVRRLEIVINNNDYQSGKHQKH